MTVKVYQSTIYWVGIYLAGSVDRKLRPATQPTTLPLRANASSRAAAARGGACGAVVGVVAMRNKEQDESA